MSTLRNILIGAAALAAVFTVKASMENNGELIRAKDSAAESQCIDTALQNRQHVQCRLPSGRTFDTNSYIHASFG